MTDSVHQTAQSGFSSAAELYQQVRPNYPQEIVTWLQQSLHLNHTASLVDLGAGTGKFIDYLTQVSPNVIAVEPVTAMLQQLKLQHPHIKTIQAASHQIPLSPKSIDAVICAQAFHWFADIESLQSIHQVLKPQGALGLVWNQRDEQVGWVKTLADLLAEYEADTPRYHSGAWEHVFQQQALFERIDVQVFEQIQYGRVEDVVSKRLLSTSFIAAMPTAQQLELKTKFEQIVQQETGKSPQDQIGFPYKTYAYHYQKQ